MITVKGKGQIRTSRNLKGFRSLTTATGVSLALKDAARLYWEEERLVARRAAHRRRVEGWRQHLERAAGPLRVLPPQARKRLGERGR